MWRLAAVTSASGLLQALAQDANFMCQCDYQDNTWVHHFSAMLIHIQDLPKTLSKEADASTQWIMSQSCEEDATVYPNSQKTLDIHEVLQLQESQTAEVHNSCLPGHLAMAMVCAQQWIAKKSLMGVVKWVSKMNELMTVVSGCLDRASPVPFRLDDFSGYMERFAGGVPPPQHPAFIQSLAWPSKAVAKTSAEVAQPFAECLPLKDPSCFPQSTKNPFESCVGCCDLKLGPTGQTRCWQDGFDFQRCCQAVEAAGVAGTEGLQKSLDAELKTSAELRRRLTLQEESLKSCEGQRQATEKELQAQAELVKGLEASKTSGEAGADCAALLAEKEQLQKGTEELAPLKTRVAQLEGQLKESQSKIQELTKGAEAGTELKKLDAEVQQKEVALQKKEAELKKKEADLQAKDAEMQKEKAGVKKKEEELEKKEAEMKKSSEAGRAKDSELQKRLDEALKQKEAEVKKAEAASKEKEAASKKEAELLKQLAEAQKQKEAEVKKAEAAGKEKAELQKQLDEAQKQKESELQQLQVQLKEVQSSKNVPPTAGEVQKAKEELKKAQQKAQQDASELLKMKAELDQLKGQKSKETNAELEKLKQDVAKASEKSKKDAIELQRLQDELQAQKKQAEALQKKIHEMERTVADGQQQLELAERARKEKDAELKKLQEEMKAKQLEKEVQGTLAATPKDLQKELKDLLGVGPSL